MGRDDLKDDNRSIGGAERAMNAEFLQPIIEKWLSKLTRDQAVAYLNKAGQNSFSPLLRNGSQN